MPAEGVTLVIDQGEDWTTDVIWTNMFDDPVRVTHPARMEIKTFNGQVVAELESNPDIPDGEIPGINLSEDIGLMQLHIAKDVTASLPPGSYFYDLFATVNDDNTYAGLQVARVLVGTAIVNKRYTHMT